MKVNVSVDNDIIRGAQKKSTCECVLARSLFREGFRNIKVTKDSVRACFNGQSLIAPVTPKLAQVIQNFDKGKKITPFSGSFNFAVLDTPKKYTRSNTKSKRNKKRGPKKGISKWSNYRYQGIAQLANND